MKRTLKNRKSYFYKILSYFCFVLGMTVFIVVVLIIKSGDVVKEQIIMSNQNTMNQFVKLLDTIIVEMRETCVAVADMDEIEAYLNPLGTSHNSKAYERYKLSKKLSAYYKEKICDIMIWFPEDNYVVSGVHGALNLESYCNTYYGNSEALNRDFYSSLTSASKYPSFYALDSWGEYTYLSITMKCESPFRKEYIISVVLDKAYLKVLLEEYHAGRGGFLLLFDKNKKLLLAGNKDIQLYNLDDYMGEDIPYETRFGEKNYIMQVCHSDDLRGYYAFAVPTNFFREQLSDIYFFSVTAILLYICLGSVLAFFASKRTYKPLANIVDAFKSGSFLDDCDMQNINEFEFLEKTFRNEWKEKTRLSRESRDVRIKKRDAFIIQLLEGNVVGEDKQDDVFERNGIILGSDHFLVGVISIEEGNSNNHDQDEFIIRNVMEEIFGKMDRGYVLYITENKYLFLLNLSIGTEEEHVTSMLETGKSFLKNNFGLKLTIGYSSIHEGMQEISEAYMEAKKALSYRYVFGKETIISYGKVAGRRFSYLESGQVMLYNRLENYLSQTAREAGVCQFVSEIFDDYEINESISLETLECFKFDVINGIVRIALECSYSIAERQSMIKVLLEKDTINEFEEGLSSLMAAFCQRKLDLQNSLGICSRAKEYIEANYYDTQLGLSQVCDAMNISTSYLTKLYKEKYGVSIPNDIARIRLLNAKGLLKNADLSINEVAVKAGFSNSNVFIKVFKKWEGITPGRYRELYKT